MQVQINPIRPAGLPNGQLIGSMATVPTGGAQYDLALDGRWLVRAGNTSANWVANESAHIYGSTGSTTVPAAVIQVGGALTTQPLLQFKDISGNVLGQFTVASGLGRFKVNTTSNNAAIGANPVATNAAAFGASYSNSSFGVAGNTTGLYGRFDGTLSDSTNGVGAVTFLRVAPTINNAIGNQVGVEVSMIVNEDAALSGGGVVGSIGCSGKNNRITG